MYFSSFVVINAENAAHRCEKFIAMATRTRTEYLKDLAQNHVTTTTLDSGSKLSMLKKLCLNDFYTISTPFLHISVLSLSLSLNSKFPLTQEKTKQ